MSLNRVKGRFHIEPGVKISFWKCIILFVGPLDVLQGIIRFLTFSESA